MTVDHENEHEQQDEGAGAQQSQPQSQSIVNNIITGDNGPGTTIRDLLPIPSDTQPVSDPAKTETSTTLLQDPSLSHALATEDHDDKGLAQQDHSEEVLNLGWNQKKQEIAEPLVGGLDNEELWMLVRRFDKVRTRQLTAQMSA